jgi:hypothetical protein
MKIIYTSQESSKQANIMIHDESNQINSSNILGGNNHDISVSEANPSEIPKISQNQLRNMDINQVNVGQAFDDRGQQSAEFGNQSIYGNKESREFVKFKCPLISV